MATLSEENKVQVEGFERIKLRVRDKENSVVSSDNKVNNDTLSTTSTQKSNNQSYDQNSIGAVIQELGQRFSPVVGDEKATDNDKKLSEDNKEERPIKVPNANIAKLIQPPQKPTQKGPLGIMYDFNFVMRVSVPKPVEGEGWRVRMIDLETEVVLLDQVCYDQGYASTAKHHFLCGQIIVSKIDKDGKQEDVFTHTYDAREKEVLIAFPVGSLGDSLGWLPYAEKFRKKHNCKLTLALGSQLIELFEKNYPEIKFVDAHTFALNNKLDYFYASYYVGLFFEDEANNWQPRDFRLVGLHRTAGYILGVDPTEEPPKLTASDDTRPIPEPYVVIATQASTQCKYWNNPFGWHFVIDFLKSLGYRVICIDKERAFGKDLVWNHIPNGAEDQTGSRPLTERVRWLKHAEFFVGLSSGLAWLAWGSGIPVVIISGFTNPVTEFDTPYRVFSTHVCNGCWNDVRYLFDHNNFLYCPKHRDTPRQFECTKAISHQHVIKTILSIPGCRQRPISQENINSEAT